MTKKNDTLANRRRGARKGKPPKVPTVRQLAEAAFGPQPPLQQLLADTRDVEEAEARAAAWERRAAAVTPKARKTTQSLTPPADKQKPAVPADVVDHEKLKQTAEFLLSEHSIAAATVKIWGGHQFADADQKTLAKGILDEVQAVRGGDLQGPEALLVSQANALNVVFHAMMMKAYNNRGNPEWFKMVFPLAMKAQNQSRMTIETLVMLKNPPQAVFPKQLNVAHQQQVNNGAAPPAPPDNSSFVDSEKNIPARARALTDARTEHETLDPLGAKTPSRAHQTLEAVERFNRPKDA
jgi:hypothetical protein